MVGSVAGVVLLGGASAAVVTEELLVNVRNVPGTPWHTLVPFSGFILVFVIEMLVHRAGYGSNHERGGAPHMVSRALPDQAASGLAVQESGGPPRADGAPKRTEDHVYNRIRWRVVYEDREQEVGDHLQDLPRAPSDEADDRARHERPAAGDEQWQHATVLGQLRGEGH